MSDRRNRETIVWKQCFSGARIFLSLALFLFTTSAQSQLSWEQRPGYRVAALNVPKDGPAGFTLMPAGTTGIAFTNHLSYLTGETNQNILNGAGVAAGDIDGDGLPDLFFANLEGPSALYRNLGNWRFAEITSSAGQGLACRGQFSRAPLLADLNGDGNLDLFITSLGGPNACFFGNGKGQFTNVTQEAGLILKAGCESVAAGDIDGDGDLDLYIANNGEISIIRGGGQVSVRTVQGKPVITGRNRARLKIVNGLLLEVGEPHSLYLNDGRGKFSLASWTDGRFRDEEGRALRLPPPDLGLSVMFRDINGDLAPDLYVCNDFQTPDRVWMNDGKGNFQAIGELAIRTTSYFSMGVDFADIDRDGRDDFFVSDMLSAHHPLLMTQSSATNPAPDEVGEKVDRHQARRNTFAWNRGDGTYAEIANYAGLAASDWSWSVVFLDVDLDGYEDLLVANGHAYDTQDMDIRDTLPSGISYATPMQTGKSLKDYPALNIPNVLFRNKGNRTFEEIGKRWGFDSTNVSHGISLADFDNDGDQDVVVSCLRNQALLYRNNSSTPRVAVRLRGKAPNTQGIGAKIKVLGGAVPVQTQEIISGGRYLAGDDPMRAFAAGSLTNRMSIEVTWRNGARSVVQDVLPNSLYEINESGALSGSPVSKPVSPKPMFTDETPALKHTHSDPPYNDFGRQALMPRSYAYMGPGAAWVDIDNDGQEELVIGSGKGGNVEAFRAGSTKQFSSIQINKAPLSDDVLGVVGWNAGAKGALLALVSNYESQLNSPPVLLKATAGGAAMEPIKIPDAATFAALAVADVDGDEDLDVFAGARVQAARYPMPAVSRLLINEGGTLKPDGANDQVLRGVGLVSSAVWSDLNEDGWPDLILACEWGPIRVLQNNKGRLREVTDELGLGNFRGWWNGVTTGDLDGDGTLDIIASNWGLNSSYSSGAKSAPVRLYFGDIDGNSSLDLLEAYTTMVPGKFVPKRDLSLLATGVPLLRARFGTHRAFSSADIPAICGDKMAQVGFIEASHFGSTVFLNRGGKFEARLLPFEAQLAPGFGINVADFDNDGHEDIFLAQNFFRMCPQEPRYDAGRGLLMLGDGQGNLRSVSGQDSGITIYGEQRGSAWCDYDRDGKVDLAVTQNSRETKLYRNATTRRGIRVSLAGPAGNPRGVGATIRLKYGEKYGTARHIHGGSGYLSDDSKVQVMGMNGEPDALWVRWPGGKTSTAKLNAGTQEVTMDLNGAVTARP